ncbi:hypothetical protein NMY22_g6472 [Coprinellus aureogranulatus]|nr:hypothetical protein NMY22_g6472 [Coprinellus aureogranulatus]
MAPGSALRTGLHSRKDHRALPNDLSQWICDATDVSNPEKRGEVWLNTWSRWRSLAPFFASHGLHLYEYSLDAERGASPPATPEAHHSASAGLPWARKAYSENQDLDFDCLEVRAYPLHLSLKYH